MFTSPFNFKQTPLKRTKKKYLLKKERENRQKKKELRLFSSGIGGKSKDNTKTHLLSRILDPNSTFQNIVSIHTFKLDCPRELLWKGQK